METKAVLRHARISPQKARLVADQVRGMPVENALNVLKFSNKKSCRFTQESFRFCHRQC